MALRCVIRSMSSSLTPTSEVLGQLLGGEGPRRVGVRVVALPHHVVHVEEVAARHAELVVDEAGEDVLVEDLAGELVAEVLAGPGVVAAVVVVNALEEVRDPADPALGQRDLQVGELAQHRRPDQVGGGLDDVHRRQRDQAVDRRVGRGDDELRRRADVHAHDDVLVAARLSRTGPSGPSGGSASPASRGSRRT